MNQSSEYGYPLDDRVVENSDTGFVVDCHQCRLMHALTIRQWIDWAISLDDRLCPLRVQGRETSHEPEF